MVLQKKTSRGINVLFHEYHRSSRYTIKYLIREQWNQWWDDISSKYENWTIMLYTFYKNR